MAVVVDREEMLRTLEAVQPGLADAKGTTLQSDCFGFIRGRVVTFNDEVSCRTRSPLGKEFNCVVKAKKLLEVLSKSGETELEFDQHDGKLVVKGRKTGRVRLVSDSKLEMPIDSVERPESWTKLPKDFSEAIATVQECAKNQGEFKYSCIHIHPQWIEACDAFQLCRWPMKTGFSESTFLRKSSIKHVTGLAMVEFAETLHWIHFRNATGLELAIRRFVENYDDFTDSLLVEGVCTALPKGFVREIDVASIFSSENKNNDRVMVEIRANGSSRVSAVSESGDFEGPWHKIEYDGESFSFLISPLMLANLIEKHNECILADAASSGRLAIDKGTYKYVAWLIKPEAVRNEIEAVEEEEELEDSEEEYANMEE